MNIQENMTKPSFIKYLSPGENWKSKSMRIIPEEFVRLTKGAFKHRIVFEVRWGNSWQMWLERQDENGLFMFKEDWDGFVDDNFLGKNHILVFTHQDTMFLLVQIINGDGKEILTPPLQPQHEPEPEPMNFHHDTSSENFERYLLNPENAYFKKKLTYAYALKVEKSLIERCNLEFGPHNSKMTYIFGDVRENAMVKINNKGGLSISGWQGFCNRNNLNRGDTVLCELESTSGLVSAVRVHLVDKINDV